MSRTAKLTRSAATAAGLFILIAGHCYAQAQAGSLPWQAESETAGWPDPSRVNGWDTATIECASAAPDALCQNSDAPVSQRLDEGADFPQAPAEDHPAAAEMESPGLMVVVPSDQVALTELHEMTGALQAAAGPGAQASIFAQFFYISDTFDWRIELGELGGPHEVGFSARQVLSQDPFGVNSFIKLDAGVNVDPTSGGARGRAALIVGW